MTLATSLKTAPGQASITHPHFVGLALLRSLASHEDVAQSSHRSDTVLDMIAVLLRQGNAQAVVRAFCKVRQACGPVCYMAVFRLRRWLEKQVMVKAGDASWEALELTFGDLRRVIQSYQRHAWEWDASGLQMEDITVHFAWAGVGVTPDAVAPELQPA